MQNPGSDESQQETDLQINWGDTAGMVVALGGWANNMKVRRVKLTPGQLAQLAEHGVEWT